MRVILTPDDARKNEPIPPGWYPAEITNYEEAIVKGTPDKPSDGSTNAIFYFTLLDGIGKGKTIRRFFNEKALNFGKNLWKLFFGYDAAKGGELTSEMFQSLVGKKLLVYVKRDGQWDSIEDYRPLAS